MRASRFAVFAGLAGLFAALLSACDATAPATGAVRVLVSTSGVDLDQDGYDLRVDGAHAGELQLDGTLIVAGLRTGSRQLRLQGLALNCVVPSAGARRVTIAADDTVDAEFAVTCHLNVGSILVATPTTGGDLDSDGYMLSLDGGDAIPISNSGIVLHNLPVGTHTLTLTEIAENCTAPSTQSVNVTFGFAATATFNVRCSFRTGTVRLTVSTTGDDAVAPEYEVVIDDQPSQVFVPKNGDVILYEQRVGDRSIDLRGMSPNCRVTGTHPQIVNVVYRAMSDAALAVTCSAFARVRMRAITTGVDPDASYSVRLVGSDVDRTEELSADGTTTVSDIAAGEYTVALEGVAVNCEVGSTPAHPRLVTLVSGSTIDVVFDVACTRASQLAFVRHAGSSLEIFRAGSNGANMTRLTSNGFEEHDPAWSPDGNKIAFRSSRDGNSEIYVMNADGAGLVRLTTNVAEDLNPAWSPDASKIAFRSNRDGNDEIYVMNADGSNPVRLTNHSAYDGEPAWSPDGLKIAFSSDRNGNKDIYVMNADGSNVIRLTTDDAWDGLPAWSPDGTRIAFARGIGCDWYYYDCSHNIFVMNADGSGVVRLESTAHDSEPAWSPDGRWIAFETKICDYYYCDYGIAAARPDGTRRTLMLSGELYNPTWRP